MRFVTEWRADVVRVSTPKDFTRTGIVDDLVTVIREAQRGR
ncbi:hypothetical protein [Micromonospora zhanjiangensis]|uniref:Uncharacterized protein n=1 Tax=Micromonospora zhanjiangensis TaxID=1522057 RepID=A0ABV8KT27_9ACTN